MSKVLCSGTFCYRIPFFLLPLIRSCPSLASRGVSMSLIWVFLLVFFIAPQVFAQTPVLTAVVVPDGIDVSLSGSTPGFELYRCAGTGCDPSPSSGALNRISDWVAPGSTTYEDRDVAPGTTYRYQARHYVGGTIDTNVAEATTPGAPTLVPPTGLTANADANGINLSWTAPSNDIVGYSIYRCEEGDTPCTPVWKVWVANAEDTPPAPTEYVDTDVTSGTTYRYVVTSNDADYDESVWSDQITETAPIRLPAASYGLTVTATSANSVSLSWTMPTDDGYGAIEGYNVYRCEEPCEPATDDWIAWVDDGTEFTDTQDDSTTHETGADSPVVAETTYRYAVAAFRGGNSGWAYVTAMTQVILGGTFIEKYQYLGKRDWDFVRDPGGITWSGQAWKGDRVHAPLIVWTNDREQRDAFEYEMTDLVGRADKVISKDHVRILFPTYVTADPERRVCDGYRSREGVEPVYLADALSTTPGPVELPSDPFKIWLIIDVPETARPGPYVGTFVVRYSSQENAEVSFTINLQVPDLRLPPSSKWHFDLNLWQHPEWALKHYNDAHPEALISRWSGEHYDLLEPFYRLLANTGQKWITTVLKDDALGAPGMVSWTRMSEDGNDWRFDFSVFGAHVEKMMSWGIDHNRIEAFGILGWNNEEIPYWSAQHQEMRVLEAPVGSTAHTEVWQMFLPEFKAYLKNKGWFRKTYLAVDEGRLEALIGIIELIRDDDPRWQIDLSYWVDNLPQSVVDKADAVNIHLGVVADEISRYGQDKKRSYYTSCFDRTNVLITPDSNLADVVWLSWYADKLGTDGYARWAYDYWQLSDPLNMRQGRQTSGDFALVYRTSNDANLQPMTSIRLEMLRLGIQDFEKRRVLRDILTRRQDPDGVQMLDNLLTDDMISFRSAYLGYARDDIKRVQQQLNEISIRANNLPNPASSED